MGLVRVSKDSPSRSTICCRQRADLAHVCRLSGRLRLAARQAHHRCADMSVVIRVFRVAVSHVMGRVRVRE